MNLTTLVKTVAWIAFLAGVSAAGVKYVAVVESDVDASSGASDELKPAEVREITAELRRQATENLPRDKYSVMTSETVQSMGGAVLEECAEENCVIALGSRIGADYIVRGTISKFQTMFTLGIELYETENGTLVVSSEAVRSEKLVELLNKAATASGNMFRKFAGVKESAWKKSNPGMNAVAQKPESGTADGRKFDYYFAPKYQQVVGTGWWSGGNLEGGVVWGNGMFAGMDFGLGTDWNDHCLFIGGGVSFGDVYDFGNQSQLVYGGSVGIWYGMLYDYHVDGYYFYDHYDFLAPFVKLRWKFVELTYRGLLGWKMGEYNDGGNSYAVDGFSYNQQLMLGLYFATNKRER
jgi:hypothetical protein